MKAKLKFDNTILITYRIYEVVCTIMISYQLFSVHWLCIVSTVVFRMPTNVCFLAQN